MTTYNETCDDGDKISGDGCSEVCQVEHGWTCDNIFCTTNCSDGLIGEGNETCDD